MECGLPTGNGELDAVALWIGSALGPQEPWSPTVTVEVGLVNFRSLKFLFW